MEILSRQNHEYVSKLAGAVQALTNAFGFERRRGDTFEVRMNEFQRLGFDLNLETNKLKASLEIRPEEPPSISAKFAVIEATLVNLQTTVAKAGTAVEQNVAAVEKDVAALQSAKPDEGSVISATFQQQSSEIGAVRDALLRAPTTGIQTNTPVGDARGISFTDEMRQSMEQMHLQFGNLTRLSATMPLVNGRLDAVVNGRIDALAMSHVQGTPHNVRSKSIVKLTGHTARGANGASLDAAGGDPTQAPGSPTFLSSTSITSSSPETDQWLKNHV